MICSEAFTKSSWWNCHPGQTSHDRHHSMQPHINSPPMQTCSTTAKGKKTNGIWPVGVGECLWPIIDKTITGLLKEDIICAVGTLQTCVGLESGIEAAIHPERKSYIAENSECLLLVDADNAFNKLNRKVSLENIRRLCPPCTHTCTTTTTHPPCYIWKMETTYWHSRAWHKGTLQQWQCMPYPHNRWYKHWAMKLQKVWYADDSSTVVSLAGVKKWWEYLKVKGHCPWNLHRPSS